MNPGIHGAFAAAHAQRIKKLQDEEEERMTRYNPEELEGDWEFKIIRSNSPVFRKPQFLQKVLQEEALAGWQMLEKLDDNRIRMKRPAAARRKDAMLPPDFNPYRTQVGSRTAGVVLVAVGLVVLLAFGILVMLSGARVEPFASEGAFIILGIVVFIALMFGAIAAGRRQM